MKPRIQAIVAELRSHFQALYGAKLVHLVLFGSQARGSAEVGSDIDVLVVLEGTVSPGLEIARTGEIASQISLKYDVVISCTFVSEDRFRNENSPLLLNVRKEGIAV